MRDPHDVGLGSMCVPLDVFAAEVRRSLDEPTAIDVFRLTQTYAEILAAKVTRDCPGCEL